MAVKTGDAGPWSRWRRERRGGAATPPPYRSEEAKLLGAVAHQQVLGLLIVIQHPEMVFAADARLLVAPECGMRRIGMIAVGPDPTRLDRPAEAIAAIGVATPDAGAEAIERVVGDG